MLHFSYLCPAVLLLLLHSETEVAEWRFCMQLRSCTAVLLDKASEVLDRFYGCTERQHHLKLSEAFLQHVTSVASSPTRPFTPAQGGSAFPKMLPH